MKIVTASSGKQIIKMSKKEWKTIGKKAGWMKESALSQFTVPAWKRGQAVYISNGKTPPPPFDKPIQVFLEEWMGFEYIGGVFDETHFWEQWTGYERDSNGKPSMVRNNYFVKKQDRLKAQYAHEEYLRHTEYEPKIIYNKPQKTETTTPKE